jgi:flagellar protein FlaG
MAGNVQDVMSTAFVAGGVGVQTERPASTGSQEVSAPVKPQQQQEEAQQEQYVKPGSMDEESTKNMTEELNKAMQRANSNLEFKYHKEVNMMSVAVVDKTSGKVIKELPPEEMVNNMIKSKIWIGAFLDKIA